MSGDSGWSKRAGTDRDPSFINSTEAELLAAALASGGEEQEKLYHKSPYNFVRLDLSQKPDSYDAVAVLLQSWQSEGILERDETPAIYFLAQKFSLKNGEVKERHGFFALTQLQDFSSGDIRPHENTLEGPKQDRLKLMIACHAQLSPIFALYSQPKRTINRILSEQIEGKPPFISVKPDGGGVPEANLRMLLSPPPGDSDPGVHSG